MKQVKRSISMRTLALSMFLTGALSVAAGAQEPGCRTDCGHDPCQGDCKGSGGSRHGGSGAGGQASQARRGAGDLPGRLSDQELFHFLLDRGESVRRSVAQLDNSVETVTGSEDSEVPAAIRNHVRSMHLRLEESGPIHMRDPLFAAVFGKTDKIDGSRGTRVTGLDRDRVHAPPR